MNKSLEFGNHSADELNEMYEKSESCDRKIHAEMRTNILLVAGDHYSKKLNTILDNVRVRETLRPEKKIRLTKNHTKRIINVYKNETIRHQPYVGFEPNNQSELSDQKSAELHKAVWEEAAKRLDFDDLRDRSADDFYECGEIVAKVYFDPTKGPILGYAQLLDEKGAPLEDEQGNAIPDKGQPLHEGAGVIELIEPYNLLRDPEARRMQESEYLIIRKMCKVNEIFQRFGVGLKGKEYEEFKKKVENSAQERFKIFDVDKREYRESKQTELMIREHYFRPCLRYPRGFFYIAVKEYILASGELPGPENEEPPFPIVTAYCDSTKNTPRGLSIIKQLRPFQVEINRAASKMAEHQITLGDDKILVQSGTSLSPGNALPGIRSINYTGSKPEVIQGRTGAQYLDYMLSNIDEMYMAAGIADMKEEKQPTGDSFAELFKSAKQKQKFILYTGRFERFWKNAVTTYLRVVKHHISPESLIPMIGKDEWVNVEEFKNDTELRFQINVIPQVEDVETKMGRQLSLNHALQFVGGNLSREDIGKLLRIMPYANLEDAYEDLTMEYDSANNIILALDRGQFPEASMYDNHTYIVQRLVSRSRQPSFRLLDPRIQEMYRLKIDEHSQLEAQRQQQLQAAKDGYIPTTGHLVSVDMYVSDPKDPNKSKRARIPHDAVSWLINRLETQGSSLDRLAEVNTGALQEISQQLLMSMQQQPTSIQQPMPTVDRGQTVA